MSRTHTKNAIMHGSRLNGASATALQPAPNEAHSRREDEPIMTSLRKILVISLAMPLIWAAGQADASSVRDGASMFSPDAVAKAKQRLDRVERQSGVATMIETIEAVPGLAPDADRNERERAVHELARRKGDEARASGIYVLISKREHIIARPLVRKRLETLFPREKADAVRAAFLAGFKKGDFDEGLSNGVSAIESSLKGAVAGRPRAAGGGKGGASTLGTFLLIVGGIFGVLLLLRLLGGLFGGGRSGQAAAMGGMGRPGMGPRFGGPGYGAPGYGAPGRGGFFSGLLGGLGGAMAGNWLYDQMSGRHGGHAASSGAYPSEGQSANDPGPSGDPGPWADQGGDGGGDWGGGDAGGGGGDWGGGDGGGGGDWGGGGGDWGGGDGGGDWGGGDGGGGDW